MGSGPSTEDIQRNLTTVNNRIGEAAVRAGRDPRRIRMVAVSKTQPVEVIRRGYQAGLREFGENRVEEALPKLAELSDLKDIQWHMVGHIQSRKARLVAPAFGMVQSVDRLKIARLLDQHAKRSDRRIPILLECNVSGEESKSGWNLFSESQRQAVIEEFREIANLESVEVQGLMTMAPWTDDVKVLRLVFSRLREVLQFVTAVLEVEWQELSMGMTDDFEVAVEEGATLVRIGRAIFGPRTVEI